jgi:hypothetical protein
MILISGIIEGLSTRKDKTCKLVIGTNELNPAQMSELFNLNQQFCYLCLKKEPFQKEETDLLDSLKTDLDNLKTPSQRLRGILYRNFEQDNKGYLEFNSYYIAEMERIFEHYKNKLND